MQTPASQVLAAIAHWLIGLKVVNVSESIMIYWLMAACMALTGGLLCLPLFAIQDHLRLRARETTNWLPYAAVRILEMAAFLVLGPLLSFAFYYPGASMLAEVCGARDNWIADPCGCERLRLWTLALVEPGGWRQLLSKQVVIELQMPLVLIGTSLFLNLVATPWLDGQGISRLRRWWKPQDRQLVDRTAGEKYNYRR